jgi:flavin reductase (DIM6/NTAB) family NADH-FMN oxidoreductase RutF
MANTQAHYYEPSLGHGLAHDPFNSIVGPRPIGWISSLDGQGRPNLAPYSFFNAFNYTPPIIGFASTAWKDTVANIQATGEFVWNLTTQALVEAMNLSSAMVPHGCNEFELAGVTAVPSRKIKVPRVLESPVNFECRLTQLIQLQTVAGETVPTWLVLGEVVAVHMDREFIEDGIYQASAVRPVLRWGGPGDYARVGPENVFELLRPKTPG